MTKSRRPRLALVGVLALALSVSMGAGVADAAPKGKKKKSANKAVTLTSNTPVVVPDRGPGAGAPFGRADSTITVGKKLKGKEVADVDVAFSASGPANNLDDLDVMLQAPNGALVFLAGDNDGPVGTTSYGTGSCPAGATTFTDETGGFISNADPPSPDPFGVTAPWAARVQPEGFPLSIMDGGKAKGAWRLTVLDDTNTNQYTLSCWSLTIKPRNAVK
jgi:subtilisin-like proprotein convertase family protein